MPSAVMTYTTLFQDIQQYLERGEEATDETVFEQIPRLIMLGQRRLALRLKILGFQVVVTSNLEQGVPAYQKPDRWRKTISINIGTGATYNSRKFLYPRSYEYCRMTHPDDTVEAEPEFYGDYSWDNLLISPTPDDDYPFEMIYYELPALLSDENMSNWATEYAPGPLLYACLLEAEPFLKDDDRIATWRGMYDEGVALLSDEDLSRIFDRTSTRKEA